MVHLLWIIGDGALFFFLLMNWQAMCTPDEDGLCEPRNWWYNLSIQVRPPAAPPQLPPYCTTALLHRCLCARHAACRDTKIDSDRVLRVRIVQVLNVLTLTLTLTRCSTCSSLTACS